jgi:hypothetical protein
MDNKYGLGSAKVATAHHEAKHKTSAGPVMLCQYCSSDKLILCSTMNDHYCKDCGQYQSDVPLDYSTGRSADY